MHKPIVVMSDLNAQYLTALECIFLEKLYGAVEIEVITEQVYFDDYFSQPRNIDMLIADEEQYRSGGEQLKKHSIAHTFLLCEQSSEDQTGDLTVRRIFKYKSGQEIFNQIMHYAPLETAAGEKVNGASRIVLVYSAAGGAGKTTTAIGLCAALTQHYKKVLYLNAEYLQSFQRYLSNKEFLHRDAYQEFYNPENLSFARLKQFIRHEEFAYVPPFSVSISALGITYNAFVRLAAEAKASGEYDYVVVDVDSSLSDEKMGFFEIADRVVIVVRQDMFSQFKTRMLQNNMSFRDEDKYIFVCNAFQKEKKNELTVNLSSTPFVVDAYIEFFENMDSVMANRLGESQGFQKLAYMLL